jgi:hypothetical protein
MFKTSAAFRVVVRLGLSLCAAVFLLPACSIVRQPSPEEFASVRQNKKAIVLFRLAGSLDGKEEHLLLESTVGSYPNEVLLSFGLANLDAGEPLKTFPVGSTLAPWVSSYGYSSPSSEIAESGWGCLPLGTGGLLSPHNVVPERRH